MGHNDLYSSAFCYPINSNSSRRYRLEVAALAGFPPRGFPGSQPVSCRRQRLIRLDPDEYVAFEKTDGVRSLVFFPSDHCAAKETMPRLLLINRQNRHYALTCWPATSSGQLLSTTACRGTVLDGELVFLERRSGGKQLSFLVFDCLAVRGQRMTTQPFANRHAMVENLMKSLEVVQFPMAPTGSEHKKLELSVKRAWPCQDLGYLLGSVIPQLGHQNDGLVITHKRAPYIFGTTDLSIKWKKSSDLTVDFRLRCLERRGGLHGKRSCKGLESPAQFGLFIFTGDRPDEFYAPLTLHASETMTASLCRSRLNGKIVECYRDLAGRWRLHLDMAGLPRVREDKKNGNHCKVVEDIVGAMEDGISESELLDILHNSQQKQSRPVLMGSHLVCS